MSDELNPEELLDNYGTLKEHEKELKDRIKNYNDKIKEYMGHNNLDTFESKTYRATYTLRKQETLNMDKLLDLFKDKCEETAKQLGIIKTKEYIDEDALESAIYKGAIDKEVLLEMNSCKEVKRTPTLTIKKLTKGE